MISLRRPDPQALAALQDRLKTAPYSYPEVGATRGEPPAGYQVDRNEALLGEGEGVFDTARAAMLDWAPFRISWIEAYPQAAPAEGVSVAVLIRQAGLWWTNVCRVIYTIDEPHVYGFAYGTLPHHAERGEERFLVRLDPATQEVRYSIVAFSRPRHILAKFGYPFARAAQRRFAKDSMAAMREATR